MVLIKQTKPYQIGGNICKQQIKFRLEKQLKELVQVQLILTIVPLIVLKKDGNVLVAAASMPLG